MSDPALPEPTTAAEVRLYGDGGMPWRPVSGRLATARVLVLLVCAVPLVLLALVLAVWVWKWLWALVALVVVAALWGTWVVRRQVPAITWAEGPEELVIRRGRIFRTLVSVPYGRMQFVDVESGPLERRFGLATVQLHTASPESAAQLPGLPTAEAEALRTRLAARGETQRAGL